VYILFILLFSGAHADYIAALKPTQISQSVDYAFKYSLLRTITSSNYEEHKKNANAGLRYRISLKREVTTSSIALDSISSQSTI